MLLSFLVFISFCKVIRLVFIVFIIMSDKGNIMDSLFEKELSDSDESLVFAIDVLPGHSDCQDISVKETLSQVRYN